jgi:hypothetical protein
MDYKKKAGKYVTWVILVVFLLIIGFIAKSLWLQRVLPKVNVEGYQAVFLDNGQQYYGHLTNMWSRYPYITDIYYINVQAKDPANPADQKMQLVKLGNEVHGPEDAMYLNKEHIVFWENLKSDSEVVKSIAKEKAQRASGIVPQQLAPAPVAGTATTPS